MWGFVCYFIRGGADCRKEGMLWVDTSKAAILGKKDTILRKASQQSKIAIIATTYCSFQFHTWMIGREKEGGWFWLNLHKKHLARAPSFDQVSNCNSQFPGHHLWITFWMCNALHQIARPCNIDHSREAFVKITDHIVPFVSVTQKHMYASNWNVFDPKGPSQIFTVSILNLNRPICESFLEWGQLLREI